MGILFDRAKINYIQVELTLQEIFLMSESNPEISRKGDQLIDAVAAVVLVTIFVVTVAYWASSQ